MSWWDIVYVIIVAIVINFSYRKGVKAGIKHSLLILDLEQDQVKILSTELKSGKLPTELMEGETFPKFKNDVKYN